MSEWTTAHPRDLVLFRARVRDEDFEAEMEAYAHTLGAYSSMGFLEFGQEVGDINRPAVRNALFHVDNSLIIVFQSEEMLAVQKHYNGMLLLDATHKVARYDLPLYFIAMNTNSQYLLVAFFVIERETEECIREALYVLKRRWEAAGVKVPCWMVDMDNAQNNALDEVFPGMYRCSVRLLKEQIVPWN